MHAVGIMHVIEGGDWMVTVGKYQLGIYYSTHPVDNADVGYWYAAFKDLLDCTERTIDVTVRN